jgi:putative RNA 2'-phosphotransferase
VAPPRRRHRHAIHGPGRIPSILSNGLVPMGRQYAHMSEHTRTAVLVGRRKDPRPVILAIDAASASSAGINLYRGSDVVWLADLIPAKFIRILETG